MRLRPLDTVQQFAAINVTSDPGAIPGPKTAPNCALVILNWTLTDGKTGHNVLGGRYVGSFAGTGAQAGSILTALNTGAQWTALAGFLATTAALASVSLRNINVIDQPLINSTTGASAPGTSASAGLPDEVAAVVTFRTAKVGPGNRGRMYIPGWANNAVGAGNIISGPAQTALQNWANGISSALSAQGYTLCIVQPHRAQYTGSTGRVHPERIATSTDVTIATVRDNHWDTIRRRGLR